MTAEEKIAQKKQKAKEYRERNKERIRAIRKLYREKNKEVLKKKDKEYRERKKAEALKAQPPRPASSPPPSPASSKKKATSPKQKKPVLPKQKKAPSKKKSYFVEAEFRQALDRYRLAPSYLDEKYITDKIYMIAGAIIQKHGFLRFEGEEIDDLKQQAALNCFRSLKNFDPSRGSAFNFLTKICKMSILNYTLRRQKHRGHGDIVDHTEIEHGPSFDMEVVEEKLKSALKKIIELQPNHQEAYEEIYDFFYAYIDQNHAFHLRDLNKAAKEAGINKRLFFNFRNVLNREEKVKEIKE